MESINLDPQDLFNFKNELRKSVKILTNLNLYNSAKWSAEALNDDDIINSILENDKIALAKSYFDCKEFDRCSNCLKDCKSSIALFIKLYSTYLSGEKRKEEDSEGVLGQQDSIAQNLSLPLILKEIELYINNHEDTSKNLNPFLYYLYGIILLKQKNIKQAQESFFKSLLLYPYNWTCWAELIASISSFDEALNFLNKFLNLKPNSINSEFGKQIKLDNKNIMIKVFSVVIHQEFFQQNIILLKELNFLTKLFPNFSFIKIQKALISYHHLDYQDSEKIFDDILLNDPFRLDDLDIYSNILYVMEKNSKLLYLAQLASSVDKFRPETCCIIANYYSLKFEHEKAIMYYRRALTLNRECLAAWTLMGHEFVELKNSHAAIESYRRAVDTNNKDFKAWYGLGQAYEVLDMHLYSLYYYQKACSLNPLDKRMWQALGNCYEKLNKYNESIKCYKRALAISDMDPIILYKLALLYQELKDIHSCVSYMKLCLKEEEEYEPTDETCKARLWLAKHEFKNCNWEDAYRYASELNNGSSNEIEEARSIAREAMNAIKTKQFSR
ncbi:anaphase promoting complex subunit CDC23 [Ascoidea rubescens DSM 1968]|uniref:Subunit of the anaphase-promoting complex/cyclosome n=1 Tax=Ascoidea rubescens DSM 1968 TaxID=1344418 RepID=A0A1D2VKH4_9ASCO|nr:subunit of the anaphase-promoting complex/cyclosome [Ascoidea rubescens DSM 1968]ODV62113.1 subunit of the anaphase-promoting complex/cyclosome [Ascoidea rubescens DSM 1968]